MARPMTVAERKQIPDEDLHKSMLEMSLKFGPQMWADFRTLNSSFKSAAEPPTCPDTCTHCSEQFLPNKAKYIAPLRPVELHSDQQAISEINGLVQKIQANRTQIRELIEVYGDTIAKRWLKRSSSRREAMLLTAKPNIYRKKHIHAEITYEMEGIAVRMQKTGRPEKMPLTLHQDAAHIPWLTLPSLTEDPLKLLALMHYRSHNTPSEWILFDCRQMRTFFHAVHFETAYNPHSVVAYGPDFGKLVQWEEDAGHKWDTIGYAAARLAPVAQRKLTDFLLKMMSLLLENDLRNAVKGHNEWQRYVESGFKKPDVEGTVWTYTASPFSAPPVFRAKHLVELFSSRLRAAQDDLWLLQTDPNHLRDVIDRFNRSETHNSLDETNRQHLLIQMTLRSVTRVKTWARAHYESTRILALREKFEGQIEAGKALPKDYEDLLNGLEAGLENTFLVQTYTLGVVCAALPSFRHHFAPCIIEGLPGFRIITESAESFRTDQLLWNFHELRQYEHNMSESPSYHFAFIDEILSKAPKRERERVDQLLLDHLSDMAATDQALSAIRYHRSRQPWSLAQKKDWTKRESTKDLLGICQSYVTWSPAGNDRIWAKLEEFRGLPRVSSNVTRESISQLLALHRRLQSYWREVGLVKGGLLKAMDIPENVALPYVLGFGGAFTKEYKESLEEELEERLRFVESKEKEIKPNLLQSAPSTFTNGVLSDDEVKVASRPNFPRIKLKTRSENELIQKTDCQLASANTSVTSDDANTIAVSRENMGLFSNMFSNPASASGRIPWNALVAALVDAGFSATCNGGSAVAFKDEKTDKGAIVFHRPHPDSKIDPEMLRGMGKRLTKWFGWDENTFILRSK